MFVAVIIVIIIGIAGPFPPVTGTAYEVLLSGDFHRNNDAQNVGVTGGNMQLGLRQQFGSCRAVDQKNYAHRL